MKVDNYADKLEELYKLAIEQQDVGMALQILNRIYQVTAQAMSPEEIQQMAKKERL